MKFIISQLNFFLQNRATQRNLRFLMRFVLLLVFVIVLYSILFHFLMADEGRYYSWVTGFYWTLTVMSTLGFGDITFTGDVGMVFTIIVLITGIVFLLVMLPFTFIQFFYAPWLEAQTRLRVPRELPASVSQHVIIAGTSGAALGLAASLRQYQHKAFLLCNDTQVALDLQDQGYDVVLGNYDDPETYRRLRIHQAAMLVALERDVRNTNIAFTVREVSASIPVVSGANKEEAEDILQLAGSSHVFRFASLLGQSLARRTLSGSMRTGEVGRFGDLVVAEAPVMRTGLVGHSLRDSDIRRNAGVTVVGMWERGRFHPPHPDTILEASTVLVLAGTQEQIQSFGALEGRAADTKDVGAAVLILGGGRVGLAASLYFESTGVAYRIVEKDARVLQGNPHVVLGSADDIDILERSGIREAPAVLITTHDDDLNIYLTIYCRRLRPDIQIISRATLDRNISILHKAGADLVMSQASLVSNTVVNLLNPDQVMMLSEGLNIFRVKTPVVLVGQSLLASGIRAQTGCSVVALRGEGGLEVNPDPARVLREEDECILIGDSQAERLFRQHYLGEKMT